MLDTFRRLLALLDARERRRFWLLFAMILVMGLLDVVGVASILPFLAVLSNPAIVHQNRLLASAYDFLGFTDTSSFLVFVGVTTFCFAVLGQLSKAITGYALLRFAYLREFTISSRLLRGYLAQPYEWFLNRHSADLGKTMLSEVDKVIQGALVPGLRLLSQVVIAILVTVLLLVVSPLATLGSALFLGMAYGGVFLSVRGFLSRIGEERVRANLDRYRVVQDALSGVKEVKLTGIEEAVLERFRNVSSRFSRHQAAWATIADTPRYLLEAVVFGGMLALLLVMLIKADGRLEAVLPVVGLFAFAGTKLFPALQTIYVGSTALRFNKAALDELHAHLTEQHPGGVISSAPVTPLRVRKSLELVDIQYTYPGAPQPALNGLRLSIEANTTVGIVGSSGAGKTTTVDVILGLLEPQSGQVLLDGKPLNRRNVRAWQRSLGYVPQQIFLADDTIAANIAFGIGADDIDMVAVERAARTAALHDFVSELPEAYLTSIGERGVRLSGGQRQRIGIARALYHDPDVLILDEGTSALDNLTEIAVMDAVRSLAHAKTIILIAHRLSTVKTCDRIFVIEKGVSRLSGNFNTLAQQSAQFAVEVAGQ